MFVKTSKYTIYPDKILKSMKGFFAYKDWGVFKKKRRKNKSSNYRKIGEINIYNL